MRETPSVSPHLHVPLQSGDDRVLHEMARRYTADTYLRRLEAADGFNLTTDVIVGFPGEDEPAFESNARDRRAGRYHEGTRVPVLASAGHQDGDRGLRPTRAPSASGARGFARCHIERCLAAWRAKIGKEDAVLIDREGRGYGDDYSPWLVSGPIGDIVSVRGQRSPTRGSSAADDRELCLLQDRAGRAPGDRRSPQRGLRGDRGHRSEGAGARPRDSRAPLPTFRDVDVLDAMQSKLMLEFVAETARIAGLDDYRVIVNVGRGGGQTVDHLHWHVLGGRTLPFA